MRILDFIFKSKAPAPLWSNKRSLDANRESGGSQVWFRHLLLYSWLRYDEAEILLDISLFAYIFSSQEARMLNEANIIFSVLGAIISGSLILAGGAWWLSGFKSDTKARLKMLEDGLSKLEDSLSKLDSKLDRFMERFISIPSVKGSSTVTSSSPLRLSELGKKVLKSLNELEDQITQAADELDGSLGENLNAYEIQEKSFAYASSDFLTELSDEKRDNIQLAAYEHGIDESGIMAAVGIVIRDHILEKRGLVQTDVDKHNPEVKS